MALAKRKIRLSRTTLRYLREKYSLSQNKLTYVLNYTPDSDISAMRIIADGINYESELRTDYDKLMEQVSVIQG